MAAIAFFFIFLTLSVTIHARESHFFNKLSNKPLNTNQQQQQPDFVPETQDSGSYGLYGGHLIPSTTTTTTNKLPENYNPVAYTTPIHSTTQDIPDEFREDPPAYKPTYNNNAESRPYSSQEEDEEDHHPYKQGRTEGYNSEVQGFEDARFMETGDMYNSRKHGSWGERQSTSGNINAGNSNNNIYKLQSEKQGMSDTRFLENGKYFYDLNMENNENMINTQQQHPNNHHYNYYNDQRAYDRYNSNFNVNGGRRGYQNHGEQEEEDQFNP